jgi:hypothetical protein
LYVCDKRAGPELYKGQDSDDELTFNEDKLANLGRN